MFAELFEIVLIAATLATCLVAGVFLTFSDFVMRALGRAGPAAGIEAMQWINREVYHSLFMLLLVGLAIASLALAATGGAMVGGDVVYWLVAAAVLYLLGVMAVTARRNVPMNERLNHIEPSSTDSHAYWKTYKRDWTRWNHLRWITALAASVCYLGAAFALVGQP